MIVLTGSRHSKMFQNANEWAYPWKNVVGMVKVHPDIISFIFHIYNCVLFTKFACAIMYI